jgi:hypothetical protein
MLRSHAWVRKGEELPAIRPMNWGPNLTMIGATRLHGWLALSTFFKTANRDRFVEWLTRVLVPKLAVSDVVVMDNAQAHHDSRVRNSSKTPVRDSNTCRPIRQTSTRLGPAGRSQKRSSRREHLVNAWRYEKLHMPAATQCARGTVPRGFGTLDMDPTQLILGISCMRSV